MFKKMHSEVYLDLPIQAEFKDIQAAYDYLVNEIDWLSMQTNDYIIVPKKEIINGE
jgi:hypothetical protein